MFVLLAQICTAAVPATCIPAAVRPYQIYFSYSDCKKVADRGQRAAEGQSARLECVRFTIARAPGEQGG